MAPAVLDLTGKGPQVAQRATVLATRGAPAPPAARRPWPMEARVATDRPPGAEAASRTGRVTVVPANTAAACAELPAPVIPSLTPAQVEAAGAPVPPKAGAAHDAPLQGVGGCGAAPGPRPAMRAVTRARAVGANEVGRGEGFRVTPPRSRARKAAGCVAVVASAREVNEVPPDVAAAVAPYVAKAPAVVKEGAPVMGAGPACGSMAPSVAVAIVAACQGVAPAARRQEATPRRQSPGTKTQGIVTAPVGVTEAGHGAVVAEEARRVAGPVGAPKAPRETEIVGRHDTEGLTVRAPHPGLGALARPSAGETGRAQVAVAARVARRQGGAVLPTRT